MSFARDNETRAMTTIGDAFTLSHPAVDRTIVLRRETVTMLSRPCMNPSKM